MKFKVIEKGDYKAFKNGEIYIVKNGSIYDSQGKDTGYISNGTIRDDGCLNGFFDNLIFEQLYDSPADKFWEEVNKHA